MMTDYVITDGRSSFYPTRHWGGHFHGTTATFFEEGDFATFDADALAIPNLPLSMLSASPVTVGPEFFGIHVNQRANDGLSGVNVKTVRSHDLASATGMWKGIETSAGVFNWTNVDSWVNTHYAAGRDLVFVLFGTPTFYSARPTEQGAYGLGALGAQAEPSDMTKWSAFCTAIATRYLGKIKYYEIWNEPNYNNDGTGLTAAGTSTKVFFYSGTYAKLSEMVRRANQAIKAVDPTAKIISPAVQGWTTSSGTSDTYFTGMMSASDGASGTMKDWVDIIGVHLYLPNSNKVADLAGCIDRVNACKTTASVSAKPTWDTESSPIGPNTSELSDAKVNQILARTMLTAAAKGVARTIYYQYDTTGQGFINRAGIKTYRETIRTLLMSGNILTVARFTDNRVGYYTSGGLVVI